MSLSPAYDKTGGVGGYTVDSYYGQMNVSGNVTALSLTAAVDPTLDTNTDYTQITGIFDVVPHGENNNVTQQTNSFTILNNGVYHIEVWANVSSSINNTRIGVRFAINGAIGLTRRPASTIETAGTFYNLSGHGFVTLSAGDVVTLYNASDKTANITWEDMVFSVHELKRL